MRRLESTPPQHKDDYAYVENAFPWSQGSVEKMESLIVTLYGTKRTSEWILKSTDTLYDN